MKYIKTFESFVNEGDMFKPNLSPAQAAAENIRLAMDKIDQLRKKLSEKPEEGIYIKAQIDVESEKIDTLKAQIRAESAKEVLANRKEAEKRQAEKAKSSK